jgi:hypothetical protein
MDWSFMAPIIEVDLEQEEIVLGSVAAAEQTASSELSSYEGIPLADLTDEQILSIATNGDFATVHRRSKEVGLMVMKFIHYFERFKPLVVSMKEKLCAPRGSKRRTMVDGREITWSEYCTRYYGCSYRWVQKLLDGDYTSVKGEDAVDEVKSAADLVEGNADPDVEQTETKTPSRKDALIAELKKDNKELQEQLSDVQYRLMKLQQGEPMTAEESVADNRLQAAEAKHAAQEAAVAQTDDQIEEERFGFVTDYFEPIIEPLSFASELDRLIRHCNMQAHVKTVLVEESPAASEGL